MKYFLIGVALLVIAIFTKYLCDFMRVVRYLEWKQQRDKLTLKQFVRSLESEYYKANMKELYKND